MRPIRDLTPISGHEHILIGATRQDWGVHVIYLGGCIEILRDAGCITDEIVDVFATRKRGKLRHDSDGDRVVRVLCGTKALPHRVQIERWITSDERAFVLPGVREHIQDERGSPVDRSREQFKAYVTAVAAAVDVNDCVFRNRPMGRFRREVEWAAAGSFLIVPHWSKIKMDQMVARAIRNTT